MVFDGQPAVRILLVFAALLLFAAVSFFYLPMEEMPSLSLPYIRVVTEFPAYPPREVEESVTVPLENALSAVKGIKRISSLSRTGLSALTLEFDWDITPDRVVVEVREAIDSLYPYLPEEVNKPLAFTQSITDEPVLSLICLPADGIDPEDLYFTLKYDLKNRLQRNPAVSGIKIRGLRKEEILIEADMEKLYSLNRTLTSLAVYLGQFLIDHPAGKLREGNRERLLRVSTGINTPSEIAALPLGPGSSLKFKDIGKVSYETEEPTSLFLYEGQAAVGIEIYKSGSYGSLQAASQILRSLPALNRVFQGEFTLILLEDRSLEIRRSLRSLLLSLILGLIAAVAVLTRLYRGISIPLITALSVLLTMGLVFFPLFLGHISLNMVSLLGMVIAVGLLADNTIIILEEIKEGRDPGKILPVLFSSSLTTILVFLPPLFVPGVTAALFRDLILTIVILISLSLPVSRFFSPVCFSLFVHPAVKESPMSWLKRLERAYKRLLLTGMSHGRLTKLSVITAYAAVLLFSILLFTTIPRELITDVPTGHLRLTVPLPGDWDYRRIKDETLRLSAFLKKAHPLARISVDAGYEAGSLRDRCEPGRSLHCPDFHLYGKTVFPEGSLENLLALMDQQGYKTARAAPVRNSLESVLTAPVSPPVLADQRLLRMVPDKQSMNAASISPSDLQRELHSILKGVGAGDVAWDREKIAVRLVGKRENPELEQYIGSLKLPSLEAWIALNDLVEFEEHSEPPELLRINRGITGAEEPPIEGKSFFNLYLFALILLFLILGILKGSLMEALLLFLSLPVSLSGSFLLLKLCGFSLNLYSFMGILIMQGTVINTAILLLEGNKKGSRSEILSLSARRIRPVLSTVLTTVCALLPVLCRSLISKDAAGGMAAAVIGGILTGSGLILCLLPLLYYHYGRAGRKNI